MLMSVESEMAQACRFLDVISNELHSLNKNIEKYLDREDKVTRPPAIYCWRCLEEIDYPFGDPTMQCAHGFSCQGCGPCDEPGHSDGPAPA